MTELKPDIDLTDHDFKRSVSRRHARIVRTTVAIRSWKKRALNGTFVNTTKLVPGQRIPARRRSPERRDRHPDVPQ